MTSRVLFFLLRTHHSQIVATRAMRNTMVSLRLHLREALKRQKVRSLSLPAQGPRSRSWLRQDTIGYNLAALRYISRQHEAARVADFYEQDGGMAEEAKVREKIAEGVKKRKRAALRS